jgi:hypothetical protein
MAPKRLIWLYSMRVRCSFFSGVVKSFHFFFFFIPPFIFSSHAVDLLLPNPSVPSSSICQAQQITFLTALLQEFSFRTPLPLLQELLAFVESHLAASSSLVRSAVAKLFKLV